MLQRKSDRHDPLTWPTSLGLRPRADTLPDLCKASMKIWRDVMRYPTKSSGNGRDPPRAHPLGSDVVELILPLASGEPQSGAFPGMAAIFVQ